MRVVAGLHAPLPDWPEMLPAQAQARERLERQRRLDLATEAGAVCLAHPDFADAPLDDQLDVRLMLAGVELQRGAFTDALSQVTAHQAECAPTPAAGARPAEWAPALRRRYLQGLVMRIRVHLARYGAYDREPQPGRMPDPADLTSARTLRSELESLDPALAARVLPDLFPPFLPGDPCPVFVARAANIQRTDASRMAQMMRGRRFPDEAVADARNGLYSSDRLTTGVVVIVFWQRADPASERLMRDLGSTLPADNPDGRLLVLGVNIDSSPDMLRQALVAPPAADATAPALSLPQVHDPPPDRNSDPTTRLRVILCCRRAPWVVVLGNGRVQLTTSSPDDLRYIRRTVRELMADADAD